jgi:hypothetical protein
MFGRFVKVAGISTIGIVGVGYLLPEESLPRSLLPVSHMLNVGIAGARMALIYKYSSKSTT